MQGKRGRKRDRKRVSKEKKRKKRPNMKYGDREIEQSDRETWKTWVARV